MSRLKSARFTGASYPSSQELLGPGERCVFPWGPLVLGHLLQSSSASLQRRSRRVLQFEPIRRAAGAVAGVLALRHDALESHLAGMGENGRAVAFDMLVEAQAKASLGQHTSKRGLAHF